MGLPVGFKTLRITHFHLLREIEGLPEETFYAIPAGRDDNILWNIGHVTCSLARIAYVFSGHPLPIPEHYLKLFGKGTNASSWDERPDHTEVIECANRLIDNVERDFAAGMFTAYQPWKVGGSQIESVEEAIAFHCFHEGLHIGKVLDIKLALGLPTHAG